MNSILDESKKAFELLLTELGFPDMAVAHVVENVMAVTSAYAEPDEALYTIARMAKEKLKGPFSSNQFVVFLREIDPQRVDDWEIEKALGIYPFELSWLEDADRDEAAHDMHEIVDQVYQRQKMDLSVLEQDWLWDILTRSSWRKPQPKDFAPSNEIKKWSRKSSGSFPQGGQPGYRIKQRRPS